MAGPDDDQGTVSSARKPTSGPERVLDYVLKHPGAWPARISEELDMAYTTTTDNLRFLVTEGHARTYGYGNEQRYVPAYAEWDQWMLHLLQLEEPRRLLFDIAKRPDADTSLTEITDRLKQERKTAIDNARLFMDQGVLEKMKAPGTGTAGRPREFYRIRWADTRPRLRLLLMKLPHGYEVSRSLEELLALAPPLQGARQRPIQARRVR